MAGWRTEIVCCPLAVLLQCQTLFDIPSNFFDSLRFPQPFIGNIAIFSEDALLEWIMVRLLRNEDSGLRLPIPCFALQNKSPLPENCIHLDASSRFIFQCTSDVVFVYDLLWKVRRKIEMPENRSWLLFVMLIAHDRVLLAHRDPFRNRIYLVECRINYLGLQMAVLQKIGFPTSDAAISYHFPPTASDVVQQLSPFHVGIYGEINETGRQFWIVDIRNLGKRESVRIPPDVRHLRFAQLIDGTLYFFGDSLQQLWQLKRIYSIVLSTGSVSQIPLSSVLEREDMVRNVTVTDGAWNHNQHLSLTLAFCRDGVETVERLLLVLDLPARLWRHLRISADMTNATDVKHRIDMDGSILLMICRSHKLLSRNNVYRIPMRQPAKLASMAFCALLRAHPKFSNLESEQLQRYGLPPQFHPLFKPKNRCSALRSFTFWIICAFFTMGIGYYFAQFFTLGLLSLKHDTNLFHSN